MSTPKVTKVKSGSPFEERESYSRVVTIDDWIFVSNCAGRNYATRELPTDAVEQTRQAFANIEGALASVGATLADVIRSRVTIPYVDDAPAVMACVGEMYRGIDPANTVTCAPLGNADFRVEIEVTAYRGIGQVEQERTTISL